MEFRVWDGTTDPRRIRAAIAVSMGMVNYCAGRRVNPARLPVMSWDHDRDTSAVSAERSYGNRFRYMMESWPLSHRDRCDVGYLVAQTPELVPVFSRLYPQYLPGGHEFETQAEIDADRVQASPDAPAAPDPFTVSRTTANLGPTIQWSQLGQVTF